MTVGFGAIGFSVSTPDGDLPYPVLDEDGVRTYDAIVQVNSKTRVDELAGLKCRVTTEPALGFASGGAVVLEGGPGTATLTIPLAEGGEEDWDALLVAWEPLGLLGTGTFWRVTARWVLLERT